MRLRAGLIVLTAALAFSGATGQSLESPSLENQLLGNAAPFGVSGALEFSNMLASSLVVAQNPGAMLERPGALALLFGPLPVGYAGQAISLRLMSWSLPWIAVGIVGLWASNDAYQKGFWGMNAAWGLINTGIAYAGLLGTEPDPAGLRTTLLINAGADVLYVVGGLYLLTRPEDTWRGSGVAVIIQGAFLLAFDLLHAFLVPGT
jgi:hypothetical protein